MRSPVRPPTDPYLTRARLTLLRDVSEPAAAALAVMVPGKRGIILFYASRGDGRHDVAAMLKISVDDGEHLVRPDR
jgi:hypothetical protein